MSREAVVRIPNERPARASSADRDAFASWIAPHWKSMSRLAFRLSGESEWEDVLQSALALAWRKRSKFDPARGSARNWLLALTADEARKRLRKAAANQY